MAFANGVLMRGPHYWAWATEGNEVVHAPVRTLLNRHRALRVPLVRSLVTFIEIIFAMFTLHRRNGLRRGARFISFLLMAIAADLGLGWAVPYLVKSTLLANVLVAVLVFATGILAMRLALGKTIWRYHGAEHKAVNAYEAGCDLEDIAEVGRHSRIHDRCGTNLAFIALFVTLVSYFILQTLPFALGGVYALLVIAVSLEFFRLIGRRPASRMSRVLLAGGRALQRSVTTAEPEYQHLQLACDALRRVIELETGRR